MRFFFQQKEIAAAQKVGCSHSADPAADDHDVVARRNRRTREDFAIAHLVADTIVLAFDCRLRRFGR